MMAGSLIAFMIGLLASLPAMLLTSGFTIEFDGWTPPGEALRAIIDAIIGGIRDGLANVRDPDFYERMAKHFPELFGS